MWSPWILWTKSYSLCLQVIWVGVGILLWVISAYMVELLTLHITSYSAIWCNMLSVLQLNFHSLDVLIHIGSVWSLSDIISSICAYQVAATVLLQSDKVEGLRVAASFMSEQSLLYLGLLGEYSCATRKRHKFLLHCMHQEPIRFPCSEVSFASAQSRLGFLERSAATLDSGLCHTW
jgi:hypothetical protein